MRVFFTDLSSGEAYEWLHRAAEAAGQFHGQTLAMECMYEPTIQGWSAPAVVEVKKK